MKKVIGSFIEKVNVPLVSLVLFCLALYIISEFLKPLVPGT